MCSSDLPHTGDREEVFHTDLKSTHHVGSIAKPVSDRRNAYVLQVWVADFVPASAETLNEHRRFIVPIPHITPLRPLSFCWLLAVSIEEIACCVPPSGAGHASVHAAGLSNTFVHPFSRASKCLYASGASFNDNSCDTINDGFALPSWIRLQR